MKQGVTITVPERKALDSPLERITGSSDTDICEKRLRVAYLPAPAMEDQIVAQITGKPSGEFKTVAADAGELRAETVDA
ncbi:hypothetical protein NMD1_01982 [Novosphingobium sp. MD-1]|nr:hypothetical protein NMD1_01982 [Novosphingobium sp. MD-1]